MTTHTHAQLAAQLVHFAESGNQQRVQLKNGDLVQGWIMEISDTALQISSGFAEKTGKEQWYDFDDIDLNQLFFWNSQQSQWQQFMIH